MSDIVFMGGGVRKDGPAYYNANYGSMDGYSVSLDCSPVKAVEADVRCSLVRILDPQGKNNWMLNGTIVQTTLLRGFVEITEC